MSKWQQLINLEKITEEEYLKLLDDSDVEIEISDDELESAVETDDRNKIEEGIINFNEFINNIGEADDETVAIEKDNTDLGNILEDDDNNNAQTVVKEKIKKKKYDTKWTNKDMEAVDGIFSSNFSEPPSNDMTPREYFKLFVNDSILENMSQQTNIYSVEKTGSSINTTTKEIEQFLGIHLLTGIVKMPSYRMYWANETRFNPIADVMPRNRFDKLRNFFHLNDNLQRPKNDVDKLYEIRPLIDKIRENFLKIEPEEYNAVDKFMIPFKGRSSLKQYMRNKPHKWGIKGFARAGASGFMYDFEIYVGKGTITSDSIFGISGDIVIRLVSTLPENSNFRIFMDNWFTSHGLLVNLKEKGFFATGTAKLNRFPGCDLKSDKDLKKAGRGSSDFMLDELNNIVVVKWLDNKCLHIASTYIGQNPTGLAKRWSVATKTYIDIDCPAIIGEYNTFMGGVDLMDMLVELYRVDIRVKRFYLRIVFHLIDVAVANAWLLYRRHVKQKGLTLYMTLLDFKAKIAHGLLKCNKITERTRGRQLSQENISPKKFHHTVATRPTNDVRYDNFGHWPEHSAKKGRCKLCKKGYSRVRCSKCNLELCLTKGKNCFVAFHNK